MAEGHQLSIAVEGRREYKEGNVEQFSGKYPGLGYCRSGIIYLLYEEEQKEGEVVHTTIKLQEDRVEIVRRGEVNFKQVLLEGVERDGWYRTPFGSLPCEWVAEEINRDEGPARDDGFPARGSLDLGYRFRFKGDDWFWNRIKISYEVSEDESFSTG